MNAALFRRWARVPVILQAARAECGLACLAMVAAALGREYDLVSLRQAHPVSGRGSTLQEVMRIAESLHLQSRALRLEPADLSRLRLPALLHWDMDHFVVLCRVNRHSVRVHDPAIGARDCSLDEVSRHFTGIALECLPGKDFTPGRERRTTRLWELFVPHPGFVRSVVLLFLLSLFLQLAGIASAFFLQLVIDESVGKGDRDLLWVLAIAFSLLLGTTVLMGWVRGTVQVYFAQQLGFQISGNVVSHLLRLPSDYFCQRHVGDLMSRVGGVREIRRVLAEDMITVVLDGAMALLVMGVLLSVNTLLGALVLAFAVVSAALKLGFVAPVRTLSEAQLVAEARANSVLMENMRAIEMLKFYCREWPRLSAWRHQLARQINAAVQLGRLSLRLEAAYGMLVGVENIAVVSLAALAVLEGRLTLGFMTAFLALKGNFSAALRAFIDKLVQIRVLRLSLERVSDITCTPAEFSRLLPTPVTTPYRGALTLRTVSYAYPGESVPAVKEVSLAIAPGEIVAILGPSGGGKSTLIKVLAGLVLPTQGQLLVDDRPVTAEGLRQYRHCVAGVLQSDQLLSGSLRDNITLFADTVDEERLRRAVAQAGIDQVIDALPMGYDSLVGDMGSLLSAGQAQRVLLARAFYHQARFLFLDEATANLDPSVENFVLQGIQAQALTTVMVTHRPAPLAIATRFFVCEAGCVREVTGERFSA